MTHGPASDLAPPPRVSDEVAYVLPMALFLAGVWAGGRWPNLYVQAYVARAAAAAIALALLWRHYTRIRWNGIFLGVVVGVVGTVQWIGMQLLLERYLPRLFAPSPDAFDPIAHFGGGGMLGAFLAVRFAGAVLVVPVMEELFWRDFLWRSVLAPNDFKLAAVGEWAPAPLLVVSGAFATVHGVWWLTAIVWALLVGWLLVRTKSLGACIVAHATTNLLLGVYVLQYHAWAFW